MKKKLLLVLSTAVAATGVVASVSAADDSAADASAINLVVSGNAIECDQAPVIVEGRTLIPLRAVAESVGAEVEWVAETKTVEIDNALLGAKLAIGSNELELTNKLTNTTETKEIDVPAQIINDRTMVPVRAVAENFGLDVDWDQDTRTVFVTVPEAETVDEETTVEETTEETTEEATTAEDDATEESTVAEEETTEESTAAEEDATEETTEDDAEDDTVEDTTEEE